MQMTSAVWPISVWSTRSVGTSRTSTVLVEYDLLRALLWYGFGSLRMTRASSFASGLVTSSGAGTLEWYEEGGRYSSRSLSGSIPVKVGSSSPVFGSQPIMGP